MRRYAPWFLLALLGCQSEPPTQPYDPGGISFSTVPTADSTILRIRVRWSRVEDRFGAADGYVHTMSASKLVTDSVTGPLPTAKRVTGTVDTVTIRVALVNDSVTLVSRVWATRRGLQSATPAQGSLFIRRRDLPPPPPDSISVDTLVIGMTWGGPGVLRTVGPSGVGQPWLDTIRFGLMRVDANGDTVYTSAFRHPAVRFWFTPAGVAQLASDSSASIFRVLDDRGRTAWMHMQVRGRQVYRDSLRLVSSPHSYCMPWPDCYYDPWWEKPGFAPELPRVTVDIPPYVPNDCPAVIITYRAGGVDTTYPTTCTGGNTNAPTPVRSRWTEVSAWVLAVLR